MIDPELAYAIMMERCVKQGIELERERIIKLLEPIAKDCENGECNCLSAESIIALINAMQK